MNTLTRLASTAAVAVLVTLIAGCAASPDPASISPRAAALADYATVSLTSPAVTDAGANPVFAWDAVDGATEYRLSLVTVDGPVWAWSGEATSVRYGGYASAPADGVGALRLRAAAWWSVAAFGADGELLAISDHRAVAPDSSAPGLLTAVIEDPEEEQPAAPLESACELFSEAEAEAFLEGALSGPGAGGVEANGVELLCSWERADDDLLTLDVAIKPGVPRETWDESMRIMVESDPALPRAFPGLGDDSYMEVDWGGTKLAVISGDVYVSVRSGFTGGAEQATIDLAVELLARFQERVP